MSVTAEAWVPRAKSLELMGRARVMLAPSLIDGTPNTMFEAMACGAAPIVGDLPSLAEWVRDGENGFVVPPLDSQALAARLVRLLREPELRRRFAGANVVTVKEYASHEREMARVEEFYERLCRAYRPDHSL